MRMFIMTVLSILVSIGLNAQSNSLKEKRWQVTKKVWNELRADNLFILDGYYDDKVVFVDPLGKEEGLPALKKYYEHLYKNVDEIKFDFTDVVYDEQKQFFTWTMKLRSKSLNDGEWLSLRGATLVKISKSSGKVIYHRDYFDTGEFIYENVWGLRWLHNYIKKQMRPKGH